MDGHGRKLLPYGRQSISEADIEAVAEVLRSDYLTTGPVVGAFEEAFAAKVGGGHARVVNSGTAALHLANLALGVQPGDVVIAPAITFAATANAARLCGAEVVFADADPATGLVTAETLDAAARRVTQTFGKRPVAAWITHYAGQMPRMDQLAQVAERHGFWLGEDACHALGTAYHFEGRSGTAGDCRWSRAACFSFHPVKTLTTGEGGAVVTNDAKVAAHVGQLRTHGISRDADAIGQHVLARDAESGDMNPWFYDMLELGVNYRLPDVLCALGLSQLVRLDEFLARRAALSTTYDQRFAEHPGMTAPLSRIAGVCPAWHLYVVLIPFDRRGPSRAALMARLREAGIMTQVHYVPTPFLSYYTQRYGSEVMSAEAFPGAGRFYQQCLSLPLFPDMENEDAQYVFETLTELLGQHG